jgi:hypothetical protein
MSNVIVWDIETVPDLKGFAAVNGHVGKSDDQVRAELGDKFPKHIYALQWWVKFCKPIDNFQLGSARPVLSAS